MYCIVLVWNKYTATMYCIVLFCIDTLQQCIVLYCFVSIHCNNVLYCFVSRHCNRKFFYWTYHVHNYTSNNLGTIPNKFLQSCLLLLIWNWYPAIYKPGKAVSYDCYDHKIGGVMVYRTQRHSDSLAKEGCLRFLYIILYITMF